MLLLLFPILSYSDSLDEKYEKHLQKARPVTIKRLMDLFDKEWGYAYPQRKDNELSHKHCYMVKADSSKVIKGNFNYSVYYSMGCCEVDKSLPLKERLQKRDDHLRDRAKLYFESQGDDIELISDSFIIVEKLY